MTLPSDSAISTALRALAHVSGCSGEVLRELAAEGGAMAEAARLVLAERASIAAARRISQHAEPAWIHSPGWVSR